jgi:hypothetical protein
MDTTGRSDREVTPDVCIRPEVELLDVSSRRLEPFVRVLRGDSTSDDVTLGAWLPLRGDRLGLDVVEI